MTALSWARNARSPNMSSEVRLAFAHPSERAAATAQPGPLDRISLRDHIAEIEIGAFQAERGTTQRICFNVVVEVQPLTGPVDDDVDRILSYDRVTEAIAHAYHATLPTDALRDFRDTMLETRDYGFDRLRTAQWALGDGVRTMLADKGVVSVAAEGFGAPGVVVSYTDDPAIQNGSKFAAQGIQIAAGVPLQCDEPEDFRTFRLGLFGLDKLYDVDATIARLKRVLDQVL